MDVPRPTVAPPGRLVRLGVVLDTRNPIERLLEVARMCDRAGIGALWVEDVQEAGVAGDGAARLDAWTALVLLAGEVRRARIGAVLDADAWPAARLARMAATLGALTGGRLELTLRASAAGAAGAVEAFREALAATTVPAALAPAAEGAVAGPAVLLAAGGPAGRGDRGRRRPGAADRAAGGDAGAGGCRAAGGAGGGTRAGDARRGGKAAGVGRADLRRGGGALAGRTGVRGAGRLRAGWPVRDPGAVPRPRGGAGPRRRQRPALPAAQRDRHPRRHRAAHRHDHRLGRQAGPGRAPHQGPRAARRLGRPLPVPAPELTSAGARPGTDPRRRRGLADPAGPVPPLGPARCRCVAGPSRAAPVPHAVSVRP